MKKIYINLIFLTFLLFVISCAPKPAPLTTWHRVIKLEVDTPTDTELINRGMPSAFTMITPHVSSVRENAYYYQTYYTVVDELFKDSVPIAYNEKIEYYINFFQTNYHKNFVIWMERSEVYMPELKQLLARQGMPTDLAYLPLIESG